MITGKFYREIGLWILVCMGLMAMRAFSEEPSALNSSMKQFESALLSNIKEQLSRQMNVKGEEFKISIDSLQVRPSIPEGTYALQVLGLGSAGSQRLDGLVNLVALTEQNGQNQEFQVSGILKVIGPTVVAAEGIARGAILEEKNLKVTALPWKNLPNGAAALTKQDLNGRRLRQSVNAGDAFSTIYLEAPLAIRVGDSVQITVLSGPGIIIRSRGVAKQEGRLGDMIRIEQQETKKNITGFVTGDKSVEVRL